MELATPRKGQLHPASGPEKAFGEALREVRKAKGISQEELALESGFDRTYVSLIERGVKSPTIRAVVKMAAVLGVPAVEIEGKMEERLSAAPVKPT